MEELYTRTKMMLGEPAVEKLKASHVIVFGIGGVGGFLVEALARAGVGELTLVDKDAVDATNINRQIIATTKTIGRPKVEVMKERVLEINPAAKVHTLQNFYLENERAKYEFGAYDYIADAVDTVTAKLSLVTEAKKAGTPIISCMGAGNKLDPTRFRVADIFETSVCPLAKVMRRELKARGIEHLKVVYSAEPPRMPITPEEKRAEGSPTPAPGSVSFVPSVAGLIMAGEIIKELGGIGE